MAIFYYGLNVDFNLTELVDEEAALANLGLILADLELIRGISEAGVTAPDIQTLSNADFDIKKTFNSVSIGLLTYAFLLNSVRTISDRLRTDIIIDDQFRARAIKFDYYDFYNNEVTSADISTSRISSWSSFDEFDLTAPIFYKGDLEIVPYDDGSGGNSYLDVKNLTTTAPPQPKRFSAEVPTHLVTMNVNGVDQKFLAMKGIPLVFRLDISTQGVDSGRLQSSFYYEVSRLAGDPPPSIVLKGAAPNNINADPIIYENVLTAGGFYPNTTFTPDPKTTGAWDLEFYYNPAKLRKLTLKGGRVNLRTLPRVEVSGLEELNISSNRIIDMPELNYIAPSLKILNISNNPLNQSDFTAAQQLKRLPATIEELNIQDCFGDSSAIDLSTNIDNDPIDKLKEFIFQGNSSTFRMNLPNGASPKIYVDPVSGFNDTLEIYDIRNQRYKYLDSSVNQASALIELYLEAPDTRDPIIGAFDGYYDEATGTWVGTEVDIDLASTGINPGDLGTLETFYSRRNAHNLVDVSGCGTILNYTSINMNSINGSSDILGLFDSCVKLTSINLSNSVVTGDVSQVFRSLSAVSTITATNTKLTGVLSNGSFSGSPSLSSFSLNASTLGSTTEDFFGQEVFNGLTSLRSISISGQGRTSNPQKYKGSLPLFNTNDSLTTISISNMGLTGNIPSLNDLARISSFTLTNHNFTTVPAFDSSTISWLNISGNPWQGTMPPPSCSNLRYIFTSPASGFGLTGSFPSFTSCTNIYYINMDNNNFSEYSIGSLRFNRRFRYLYLRNNKLSARQLANIIEDMYVLKDNKVYSTIRLYLQGNTPEGATSPVTFNDLRAIDGISDKIDDLIDNYGFSIYV